jgi:hypothetical protein
LALCAEAWLGWSSQVAARAVAGAIATKTVPNISVSAARIVHDCCMSSLSTSAKRI